MSTKTAEPVEETPEEEVVLTKQEQAEKLTRRFVLWSAGGSLVPISVLDVALVIGSQVKMVSEMSKIYDVSFNENRVKSIVTSLIGSLGFVPAGTILTASLVKLIPGIGAIAAGAALPVVVGGITYATGKVFIMHFESGGSLLDFKPEKMKGYFKEQFEKGKEFAKKAVPSKKTDSK